jgi:hypothetical protein
MLNLVAAVSSSTSDSADSNYKTAKNSSFKYGRQTETSAK